MSVFIKGMEMPKSCYKCDMKRRNGMDIVCPVTHERFSVADVNILDYRLASCPIVPVSPHGRLIDANSETFPTPHRNPSNDYMKGWNACLRSVQQQPTIIPAEEGE